MVGLCEIGVSKLHGVTVTVKKKIPVHGKKLKSSAHEWWNFSFFRWLELLFVSFITREIQF